MNPIKVNKEDLAKKVAANRALHRSIFDEAVEGYHKKSLELLQSHIDEIKAGRMLRVSVSLPFPEDHTDDYDRVLAMLEMSLESEIEIDENTFASYVMDDWQWKKAFLTTNSAYSVTARASL
jgi:hypothetical protein